MPGRAVVVKRIVAAALLLLAACQQQGADGYIFERKEFQHLDLRLIVVIAPNLERLRASAPAGTLETVRAGNRELMAWSVLRPGKVCEMHVVDPFAVWLPEFIGHEVAHCIWGRWHK